MNALPIKFILIHPNTSMRGVEADYCFLCLYTVSLFFFIGHCLVEMLSDDGNERDFVAEDSEDSGGRGGTRHSGSRVIHRGNRTGDQSESPSLEKYNGNKTTPGRGCKEHHH